MRGPAPQHRVPALAFEAAKKLDQDLKITSGKPAVHFLPSVALLAISAVFAYGASPTKYPPGWTWAKPRDDWREVYGGAAYRHLIAYIDPTVSDIDDAVDEGSGLSHLAMAGANVMIALWHEARVSRGD